MPAPVCAPCTIWICWCGRRMRREPRPSWAGWASHFSAPAVADGSFHQHLPPAGAHGGSAADRRGDPHQPLSAKSALSALGHFKELADRSVEFQLGDRTARTLGPEEMLWHVYRHAFCNSLPWSHLRLIWVADGLCGGGVARTHGLGTGGPALPRSLAWAALATTFSRRGPRPCGRIWDGVRLPVLPPGWGGPMPGIPFGLGHSLGRRGWAMPLAETFWPSKWWMRLHYGVADRRTVIWAWRMRHGRRILAQVVWAWPLYRRVQIPLLGSWRRSRSVLTDPPRHNNS